MKTYETKKTTVETMGTIDGLRKAYRESATKAYDEIVNLRDALKALVVCDYDAADAAAAKTKSDFHVGLIYDPDFYILNCSKAVLWVSECVNECETIIESTLYQLSDDCDYSYEYYYYDPCGLFAENCVHDALRGEFDPDVADTRMLIHDDVLPEIMYWAEIYDVADRINNEINFFEMQYADLCAGLCDMELGDLLPAVAEFLDMCQDFSRLIEEPIVNECDHIVFGPWGLYDIIIDEAEWDQEYKEKLMVAW